MATLPDELISLVKSSEGCKLESYLDSDGIWTIGWGATGPEIGRGLVWTQEQADARLEQDLTRAWDQTMALCPNLLQASPGKQSAIVDFTFNEGSGRLQHSTMRSAICMGAWGAVKAKLAQWIYGNGKVLPGLVARRGKEITLIDA